ncbi:unnamed protein product, partial [Mesorhabditis belari]|uniref:Uncharacterized protein n=1 Tax=Mesorhabditis belari TaxID=2138241 RepID=A0AAF3EBM9_9BILA
MGGCLSGMRRSKKPESLDDFAKIPVSTRVNTWLTDNELVEEPVLQSHYSLSDLRRACEAGGEPQRAKVQPTQPVQQHLQSSIPPVKVHDQNQGWQNAVIHAEIEPQQFRGCVDDRLCVSRSPSGTAHYYLGNNSANGEDAQIASPLNDRFDGAQIEAETGKPISAGGDSQLADYVSANEQFDLSPTRRDFTPPDIDQSAHEYHSIVDRPSHEFLLVLNETSPHVNTSNDGIALVDEDNNSLNLGIVTSPESDFNLDHRASLPIVPSFDHNNFVEKHNLLPQTPKFRSFSDECRRLCPMPTPIRTNMISPSCYEKVADENGRVLATNSQFRQFLEETKAQNGASY